LIQQDFPADFPFLPKRPDPASRILSPEQETMHLEFHQLDRRWEQLRVREPQRQRRLLASLADIGQQTPIVVIVSPEDRQLYLVIDGYKRIAALEQLGRDTVEATVWAMSEAEAVLLSRSLRFGPAESALEQGWLLAEMERRFGYSLDELGRRFDRSASWVSRRLALVELLPESIQQQVREGKITAQVAMKYLVPVARVDAEHCQRMAAAFVAHGCNSREAGQLYAAWRKGTRAARERILAEPELFLKTQRQPPPATPAAVEQVTRDLEMAVAILHRANRRLGEALAEMNGPQQEQTVRQMESARRELARMAARIGKETESKHAEPGATHCDSGTERAESEQTRDRPRAASLTADGAQSSAGELQQRTGDPAGGESGALPRTDPGTVSYLQGESRASP
jgi:ParB family transcriptional regulator, chromosome partitioning protein